MFSQSTLISYHTEAYVKTEVGCTVFSFYMILKVNYETSSSSQFEFLTEPGNRKNTATSYITSSNPYTTITAVLRGTQQDGLSFAVRETWSKHPMSPNTITFKKSTSTHSSHTFKFLTMTLFYRKEYLFTQLSDQNLMFFFEKKFKF